MTLNEGLGSLIFYQTFSKFNNSAFQQFREYPEYKTLSHDVLLEFFLLVIPVNRRVKGYTRFDGKYVIGRRKRFRPQSRVDLAMSVRPYER